jgi:signal transduction histidine kinase/CheY-like chemotaxis protein/ABC-type amino acid transport substrate-binding protein/HPt (histidine-containing phosphotransfer) domain-containing protein
MLCVIALYTTGCRHKQENFPFQPDLFKTYRDIPGVTAQEISDIEAIKEKYSTFIYGMTMSTEAFIDENDEVNGYAAFFCEWLRNLFGIRFQPRIFAWNDLLGQLDAGDLDFAGNLIINDERRQRYHMTDAIAERQYKMMRLAGTPTLDRIALERPLRYAFLSGAVHSQNVASVTAPGTYEPVWVNDYTDVYDVLESEAADAFIAENIMEASFSAYENMQIEDFLPLLFSPVAMTTAKAELKPFISVITKAQRNGAMPYLNYLFNQGYEAYKRYKFFSLLNNDEKAYLKNTVSVPVAYQYFNYPIAFYDFRLKKWDGISIDILREIEKLTGLGFEVINDEKTDMAELIAMLADGRAHLFCDLIYTTERAPFYLWNKNTFMTDQYALLSKIGYPNVNITEIPQKRISLIRSTAYEEMFHTWFPNALYVKQYNNSDDAFHALERDEVDLVMVSKSKLLWYSSYYEFSGYKANFLFNYFYESAFSFNKDQMILCSIMDKAVSVIDTKVITEQWLSKTYDFRERLLSARQPWLIGAISLSLTILCLVLFLLYRNRKHGKRLEKLVSEVSEANKTKNTIINVLENVLNNIDAMIVVTDPATDEILFINESMKQNHGLGYDCVGKLCYEVFQRGVDKRCDFCPCHQLDREPDKIVVWEGHHPVTKLIYRNSDRYIDWPNGKKAHIQHSIDMTELIAAKDFAEQSSYYKSNFLATVSHEIRTPMNAILGISEIQLQNGNLPPDIDAAFSKIYDSGDLLLCIINDILDLSKIEAGKLELTPSGYNLLSMINDTVQLNSLRFESKAIQFILNIDEKTPIELLGDEYRIKQVLNNILSNAYKYTNEGKIEFFVSTESIPDAEHNENVILVFRVVDTGQGMTKEQVEKLFDEYTRFNTEANRTSVGVGLGMSIAKRLVELMHGEIHVESEAGKGTIFTVRVPQIQTGQAVCGSEFSSKLYDSRFHNAASIKKTQVLREYMPYGRVLVVDDVESNLYVIKGMLDLYGINVEMSSSGFDAIEKIKNSNVYDIVFMDHMMPKMDGIETVKIIRDMGYAGSIVALTANALIGRKKMFLQNGFDGFVSKPIDSRELNLVLNDFIRNKKPPEVVDAARKEQQKKNLLNTSRQKSTNSFEVVKFFIRDAENAIKVLENLIANDHNPGEEEIRLYTITVHGMKSALANIGENELSIIANKLEQTGRSRNIKAMFAKTPEFINSLKSLIEKIKPPEEDNDVQNSSEDLHFLHEKLLEIKTACTVFDNNIVETTLNDLLQKKWPNNIKNVFDDISMHILHSDYEKAADIAENFANNMANEH